VGISIGLLNVRRSILIQAPPERVWQEFESFDRFKAWFGQGHELHQFEPKLGAQVDLSVTIDGEQRHFGGPVIVLERAREVTFESNWESAHAWPLPTFFTLRLTPMYDGTMVEIFHHGFERLGADAADSLEGYEEGWDVKHLKALRAIVEPIEQ
jgi:uncharacterized protein YndB with AHSA1/START domain